MGVRYRKGKVWASFLDLACWLRTLSHAPWNLPFYLHAHVHSSTIHNSQEWKQLNCCQQMNGHGKCDILFTILVSIIGFNIYLTFHTNEVLVSLKKEWSSDTCYMFNMDEPLRYYGKRARHKQANWCVIPFIWGASAQFSSVQSLSHVPLFVTPWIAARQASLSITNSRSSLRLTSIESVIRSSHLILGRPLLLLPPIPPSIRVFSNESTLHMRWPKYWSFSFSISPSKEIPGLISFRMDW